MASTNQTSQSPNNLDRYVVVHVATTCDEHGVYVTKDSAEVIELGWILLDAKNCEEVYGSNTITYPAMTNITIAPSGIDFGETRQYPDYPAVQ